MVKKKLTLLIIDEDAELRNAFKSHFEEFKEFDVLNPVCSGDEAIAVIEKQKPNIVIMDLILPVFDGMYIVDYISEKMNRYNPVIYMLSNMGSAKTATMLNDCTAVKYYSIKPVRPQTVAQNLFRLIKASKAAPDVARDVYRPTDMLVEDYLKSLGLQSGLISTKCARVAIEMGLKAGKNERVGMMDMYRKVGQVFTPVISSVAVDRNIRSVTSRVKKNCSPVFEKFFASCWSNGDYHLCNSVFIWESVDLLKRWISENPDGRVFGN
ncbi:MAG: response regulator [Defluviitaleaceae bacterium]|nr:response regulator [Defluviitaleaceae bacterium]